MNIDEQALELHRKHKGKIALAPTVSVRTRDDLSLAYTPGVGAVSRYIAEHPSAVHELTAKDRWVAVVSDGSAVLGLGNIGPGAAAPVMEGKCVLFKEFAGIDAFPILLDTQDTEEIIRTVKAIAPSFGAINLEDIAAPRCFDIETRLIEELAIPVMHDDQHGTAIVVTAGLLNASVVVEKEFKALSVVIVGSGAAGTAIARMLISMGVHNVVVTDRGGILGPSRTDLNAHKNALREISNPEQKTGTLADALVGADVVIGVSGPDILTDALIKQMAPRAIVFALSNPVPEIMPHDAQSAGAAVIATGRSDFPNQINNVLAYPGVFQGALRAGASRITERMKHAAAHALARAVPEPTAQVIIPDVFMPGLVERVAQAVIESV
jgi:malate dehydrogenase (oxaloacetate-decarboxylating)